MSKGATNQKTEMESVSEQELDAVAGGGELATKRFQKPVPTQRNNVQDNLIQTGPMVEFAP